MSSPDILGLDLGTTTGWAELEDGRYWSGSILLPGPSDGEKFLQFQRFLVDRADPKAVWFERPVAVSLRAKELHFGLRAVLLLWCVKRHLPAHQVAPSTLKKWATGNGRAGKIHMVAKAMRLAPDITDDNEADAVLVAEYGFRSPSIPVGEKQSGR